MVAVEMLRDYSKAKTGSTIGCAPGRCGACPVACFRRPQSGELGKVYFVGKSQELYLYSEKSKGLREGTFIFSSGPARQGNSEPPIRAIETSEKNCSECNKPASSCTCRR